MPPIKTACGLGCLRDALTADVSLLDAFDPVQLVVTARVNRIITGNVKHPTFAHLNGIGEGHV